MKRASPLRYPGGKWRIAGYFERLLTLNDLGNCTYIEPYAGGASLALSLLIAGKVQEIHLNDVNPAVCAFWTAVLTQTNRFLELIGSTPLSIREWRRQKQIYDSSSSYSDFEYGFATFYLNRTNHSGIMNGGPIGGQSQSGTWKIDARFNREDLQDRVRRIGALHDRIHLKCEDAVTFLSTRSFPRRNSIVYLDPPYYRAGPDLYMNWYRHQDHLAVRTSLNGLRTHWVVSYDDDPEVRKLYRGLRFRRLSLLHTARTVRTGRELLFASASVKLPRVDCSRPRSA